MNKANKKIIALVGPTASGKSSFAVSLAQQLQTEIVSADSRLVYKKMDIGTAKPSLNERQGIKHNLIDVVEPNDTYSLGRFLDDAEPVLNRILSENKIPIVVGGTGFYFKGLFEDMSLTSVKPNPEFRDSLKEDTTEILFKKLKQIASPKFDWKMSSTDRYRIIRALEIEEFFDANSKKESCFENLQVFWFGLNTKNRDLLRERIKLRVISMLEQGLVDEVNSLIDEYGELEIFRKTIGYSEVIDFSKGKLSEKELVEKISISTGQYSKRQMTWFRSNKKIKWMDCHENNEELLDFVLSSIRNKD